MRVVSCWLFVVGWWCRFRGWFFSWQSGFFFLLSAICCLFTVYCFQITDYSSAHLPLPTGRQAPCFVVGWLIIFSDPPARGGLAFSSPNPHIKPFPHQSFFAPNRRAFSPTSEGWWQVEEDRVILSRQRYWQILKHFFISLSDLFRKVCIHEPHLSTFFRLYEQKVDAVDLIRC